MADPAPDATPGITYETGAETPGGWIPGPGSWLKFILGLGFGIVVYCGMGATPSGRKDGAKDGGGGVKRGSGLGFSNEGSGLWDLGSREEGETTAIRGASDEAEEAEVFRTPTERDLVLEIFTLVMFFLLQVATTSMRVGKINYNNK